ncbi:hypothetical protein CEXT_593361 [Caerostris extrusa]|uniref:Uncharacterized protein n=1 Tax=Caerostris extrusa TaxID=172846 RepID=A0AAV4TU09_CAEEX|nr:hypothetical protein CEXT_593361 [Caerostris extrusa]
MDLKVTAHYRPIIGMASNRWWALSLTALPAKILFAHCLATSKKPLSIGLREDVIDTSGGKNVAKKEDLFAIC